MKAFTQLFAIVALSAGTAVAEDLPRNLSVEMADPAFAARLYTLFGDQEKPVWLEGATEAEPVHVTLGETGFTVFLACKKHDCGDHQLVVMASADEIYALRFEAGEHEGAEQLQWFGLDGEPESQDVKTVIYAAISGSLYNNPARFQWQE